MKKLPVGTQAFEKLRKDGAIYIDKTEHIYNLINNGSVYFLSRPRRFGKSLLISTFKELFKGNKEIFEGLYIYDKWDWSKKYPIIHLDFTEISYKTGEELRTSLNIFLDELAKSNNITITEYAPLDVKFAQVIERLHQATGQQVAVLIDEYDKPMIDSLNKTKEIHQEIKETLHNFYQVIKGSDEHIKFMFMTGVSRFAGLSVFSALNNLNDITMDNKYASICGCTQEELESNFKEYIEEAGKNLNLTYEETIESIKRWYNGYSWEGKTFVYNPFSTLSFFDKQEFIGYWFETGTPTFLIEQIRKRDDLESFSKVIVVGREALSGSSFEYETIETTALLFQTGYLTIKKKESTEMGLSYTLDFPNYEVKTAFLTSLIKTYIGKDTKEVQALRANLLKVMRSKDSVGLEGILKSLYANIPYNLHIAKEAYYHSLFLMLANAAGIEVNSEVLTDIGRIDVVLKHKDFVVVIEIKYAKDNNKVEEMLKEAMVQIRRNKYYEKYTNNNPILLGIVFSENKDIACRFESI